MRLGGVWFSHLHTFCRPISVAAAYYTQTSQPLAMAPTTAMYDGTQQAGAMGTYHNPMYNQQAAYAMGGGAMYAAAPRPVVQNGMAANYAGYPANTAAAMNRVTGVPSNMMLPTNQAMAYNQALLRQNYSAASMYAQPQQSRLPTAMVQNAYQAKGPAPPIVSNSQAQASPAYPQTTPMMNTSAAFRPHPSSVRPAQAHHAAVSRVDHQQSPLQSTAVPPTMNQAAAPVQMNQQPRAAAITESSTAPMPVQRPVPPAVNGELVQRVSDISNNIFFFIHPRL